MSSDSEDDCYGNIAQKLQSLKNKYAEDKIETTNLLNKSQQELSVPPKTVEKVIEIADNSPYNACEVVKADSDYEDISLDTIIAQNTKKRPSRKGKRKVDNADISKDNILPTRSRKRCNASKAKSSACIDLESSQNSIDLNVVETLNDSVRTASVNTSKGRTSGRSRGRKGRNRIGTVSSNINTSSANTTVNNTMSTSNTNNTPAVNSSSSVSRNTSSRTPRSRGPRGRHLNSRRSDISIPDFISAMFGFGTHSFPTYSVGNTDEYPDESYNQPLFKAQPKKDEVVIVGENEPDLNDSLDENEELSVKVYWQNRECVKFTIRRFQKLQQIFDFFSNRENVTHEKLFFTYNDKILKKDDTPDSITYSIAKFIDGGIISQSVLNIGQKDRTTAKGGIKLKFQCQNMKKPYEIYVRPEEKLAFAMMRCAEHLEKPLEKLKFLFDGDVISGKNTSQELDLEGGECIDVKIIS